MHLGRRCAGGTHRLKHCLLGSSDSGKDVGLIVSLSRPCDAVTNRASALLGCINRCTQEQGGDFTSVDGVGESDTGVLCPVLASTF